ncbi:MAG TPA: hypothetical protein IAB55_06210 [Candidatus Merdivicinus faecavium]|nr:hypothetical protein [Candidatus Merdivicinus faecavium]
MRSLRALFSLLLCLTLLLTSSFPVTATEKEVSPTQYISIRYPDDTKRYYPVKVINDEVYLSLDNISNITGYDVSVNEYTIVVRKDGEYGLLYRDGTTLIEFGELEAMAPSWNNQLWAKQDGLWGLIDLADAKSQAGIPIDVSSSADSGSTDSDISSLVGTYEGDFSVRTSLNEIATGRQQITVLEAENNSLTLFYAEVSEDGGTYLLSTKPAVAAWSDSEIAFTLEDLTGSIYEGTLIFNDSDSVELHFEVVKEGPGWQGKIRQCTGATLTRVS